jgi:probable rRNA maturation factor
LIGNSEDQELVNSENIMGEILISSEYLERNQRLNREELVRMIVHGILHVLGYEHEGYFSEEDTEPEKMFVKQEKLVNKILKKI